LSHDPSPVFNPPKAQLGTTADIEGDEGGRDREIQDS
jgi:hypothetical protein